MRMLLIHNYYQVPGGENLAFENLCRLLKQFGQEIEIYSKRSLDIRNFNVKRKILLGIEAFFSPYTWHEIRSLVR
ncbi:MAG: hypothetical protein QXT26_04255, partial [Thermoproteota archaeon]